MHLCVCAEHMALDLVHGVHPVGNGSQVEPPEHHLILGQSPWENIQTDIVSLSDILNSGNDHE